MATIIWRAEDRRDESVESIEAMMPVERAVRISLSGKELARLHCTPDHLEELATGFLLGQGICSSRDDIVSIKVGSDNEKVDITLADNARVMTEKSQATVIYSGCGQGPGVAAATAGPSHTLESIDSFRTADLKHGLREVLGKGDAYRATRGMHSAGLLSRAGRLLCHREDVGRHNALDKVLGWAAGQCLEPGKLFAASSGRISVDAVMKLARFRVPLMISKGVPTSLALERAEEAGLTLTGTVGGGALRVYTHSNRVEG